MLDIKKKINFADMSGEKTDESSTQQQPEQPLVQQTTPTAKATNPFITPMTESTPGMSESWVELAPSRTSLCSSVDINMVIIDEKDKDSRLSPVSIAQSPHVEFESLEQVKYKLVKEMLPPGKTDWIWDWSSRPENTPPKTVRIVQYGSNLTTPPNSPEPEMYQYMAYESDSLFNVRVVFGFLVTNIFSFVVGAAVGYVARLYSIKNILSISFIF
ncbi:CRE-DCT-1 protein [Caenorhabditis remanei]|uniref:CRE-DCT-1 protein n=1 Tax=Caenorhabditis remanei TaxID=31234 RepID=E3LCA7_CAERE|nr:CRE-DCT-1 protein [Caenorhabditis remanei]